MISGKDREARDACVSCVVMIEHRRADKMLMPKTLAVALLVLAAKVESCDAAAHAASAQFSDMTGRAQGAQTPWHHSTIVLAALGTCHVDAAAAAAAAGAEAHDRSAGACANLVLSCHPATSLSARVCRLVAHAAAWLSSSSSALPPGHERWPPASRSSSAPEWASWWSTPGIPLSRRAALGAGIENDKGAPVSNDGMRRRAELGSQGRTVPQFEAGAMPSLPRFRWAFRALASISRVIPPAATFLPSPWVGRAVSVVLSQAVAPRRRSLALFTTFVHSKVFDQRTKQTRNRQTHPTNRNCKTNGGRPPARTHTPSARRRLLRRPGGRPTPKRSGPVS